MHGVTYKTHHLVKNQKMLQIFFSVTRTKGNAVSEAEGDTYSVPADLET